MVYEIGSETCLPELHLSCENAVECIELCTFALS